MIGQLALEFTHLLLELVDNLIQTAPEIAGRILGSEILLQFGNHGDLNGRFVRLLKVDEDVDIGDSLDKPTQLDNLFRNLLASLF